MKNKALLITVTILTLIAGVVAWLLLKKKTSISADPGNDSGSNPGSSSTELSKNENLMPLQRGSGFGNTQQAQLVEDLQKGLNTHHGANISIDGDFGSQTESALRSRGLPIVIYWKEWSYITQKPIYIGGKQVQITKL